FDGEVFRYGFNYKCSFIERSKIGGGVNARLNLLLLFSFQSFFLNVALETLVDRGESSLNKLILHVVQDHVITGARRDLRDPIPHRPRANNPNHFTQTSLL